MSEKLSDTDGYAGNNDLNPNYNWDRAIPAPGHSGVDFEKRVDFDRLHKYRLARAKEALFTSELGALLCFDNNNIRYLTSTAIGEWSRDKIARYALLMGDEDPHLWDFGSAAAHHRLPRTVAATGKLPCWNVRIAWHRAAGSWVDGRRSQRD